MSVKLTVELPNPPDGWEYTGEYRSPEVGETYCLGDIGCTQRTLGLSSSRTTPYWILKPKRWRAERGEEYWFIKGIHENVLGTRDEFDSTDMARYQDYNYFKTKEDAEQMAEKIRNTLKG